ncbi:MAG TPA: glycosyltransferase family 4 protein, partial [Thermoplasmata archaeon]|nr:glycosyltransferase family 4 protein [Thermoplasmata archaeon]
MRPVAIAQLSTRYPPAPGGVERHVEEISRRLVGRGHPVTVYTSRLYREFPWQPFPADFVEPPVPPGLTVQRVPAWSLPGELHYPFFRGLYRRLETDRPDLMHVHTYGTNHATVARRYHRRTGVPYILTAHYHPIWSIHGGRLRHLIRGFYDRRLAAPIVGDAARLIVQTHEEERLVRANGFPLPRVEIIPPGYTPATPPTDPKAFRRAFGIDGPFVLFVGRLASNKGLPALVRAFADLHRHDPSAYLALVGADGGEQAAVERQVKELGLGDRVRLTGFIADESLLAAGFREARLFALASQYEAFGLVLLESLAQGTPVIASRVGGIPEFV